MVTWDESDSEKSSISNDGQANIYLMADTNDKTKCKNFEEKFKDYAYENTELRKSNEDLKKKIQTIQESLSLASKTDETFTVEKLSEEVIFLSKDFEKFLESSKTLTTLLKFHQHPHDKSDLGFEKGTTSSKSQFISNKCNFCGKSGHSEFK
ncbi:hypothetical protein HKD37_09G025010 [Glycine soja]